jgi:hypothetical protein
VDADAIGVSGLVDVALRDGRMLLVDLARVDVTAGRKRRGHRDG